MALVEEPLLRLVASLAPSACSLRQLGQSQQGDAGSAAADGYAVAIGPEGDFSEAEYAALSHAGWQHWKLGALTLRSETAAICALSILGYECAQ